MKADIILVGNAIFDSIIENPFKGYVAIKDNKIFEVSRNHDYSGLIDYHTEIRKYDNQLIMAGFHDSHTHLLMAGMYGIYANLLDARSEEESAMMVRESAEGQSQDGWVIGFSWYHVFWDKRELPRKETLDVYFPNRPVCLINAEAHGAWVNSKALEIAGITKDTPDPFGGEIIRDSQGEPTGTLLESATGLITKFAFDLNVDEEKRILTSFMEGAKAFGITSINDVQPYFHGNMGNLDVYEEMAKEGQFTSRVHVAVDLLGDLEQAEKWKRRYHYGTLRVDMLKQFIDGVATTHTALMIDDYADAPGNRGISLFDIKAIEKAVPEAHKRGFSVKLHSCGDQSAKMCLDYYENAIRLYGKNQCRHAIEHLELVDEKDIPRFNELGIIPSVQPEHLALTQIFEENPYPIVLGAERANRTWPFKSLYDSAGILAIGSDCPVVSNNPFLEIYRAITRLHNDGKPEGGWNPTEKLTMYQVLRSYTYGGAYGVRRENEMGSLEKGKLADIIVIDKNLFEINVDEIISAQVILTIMDGEIVYERKGE